ncbi:hypothetical protein [Rhizobium sp. LjRoot254]|uniref:hypothetical protein n=1 Tax=Rhizobium sp. LjRoot254 TaxID=3342297 RepID=UPI003ECE20F5
MNRWVRQIHRWLAIAFTVGFIANIVTLFGMGHQQPPVLVGMMALVPLMLLLLTGLYMFALPYFRRSGDGQLTGAGKQTIG